MEASDIVTGHPARTRPDRRRRVWLVLFVALLAIVIAA